MSFHKNDDNPKKIFEDEQRRQEKAKKENEEAAKSSLVDWILKNLLRPVTEKLVSAVWSFFSNLFGKSK